MFSIYDLKEFKIFFIENVISRRPKRLEQAYLVAKFENPECTLMEPLYRTRNFELYQLFTSYDLKKYILKKQKKGHIS